MKTLNAIKYFNLVLNIDTNNEIAIENLKIIEKESNEIDIEGGQITGFELKQNTLKK